VITLAADNASRPEESINNSDLSDRESFLLEDLSSNGDEVIFPAKDSDPEQGQEIANAANQLHNLALQQQQLPVPTGKSSRKKGRDVDPAVRMEQCRLRLEAKGIKWDPALYRKIPPQNPQQGSGVTKRARAETTTPPSAEARRKRPRAEGPGVPSYSGAGGSYRAAVSAKKVAIVPTSFPESRLTDSQGTELEGLISEALINYQPPSGEAYPSSLRGYIHGVRRSSGILL